jgi:hypothetical protein
VPTAGVRCLDRKAKNNMNTIRYKAKIMKVDDFGRMELYEKWKGRCFCQIIDEVVL